MLLPAGVAARYRVIEPLGAGGTGVVYEAERVSDGQRVALKVMRADLADPEAATARFQREAELLSKLRHPRLVRVFEWGVEDGQPWLAMERITGRDLQGVLDEGTPPAAQALAILRHVADALVEVHAFGIVHRDLKPANVMLAGDRGAMLADFGVAGGADFETLTRTGAIVGTPYFMALEQFDSGRARPAVDVHAFGALAYRLLEGELPFSGGNLPELVESKKRPPTAAPGCRAAGGRELEAAILRCLDPDPGQRPVDMVELRAALDGKRLKTPAPPRRPAHAGVPVPAGPGRGGPAPDGPVSPLPLVVLASISLALGLLVGGPGSPAAPVGGPAGPVSPAPAGPGATLRLGPGVLEVELAAPAPARLEATLDGLPAGEVPAGARAARLPRPDLGRASHVLVLRDAGTRERYLAGALDFAAVPVPSPAPIPAEGDGSPVWGGRAWAQGSRILWSPAGPAGGEPGALELAGPETLFPAGRASFGLAAWDGLLAFSGGVRVRTKDLVTGAGAGAGAGRNASGELTGLFTENDAHLPAVLLARREAPHAPVPFWRELRFDQVQLSHHPIRSELLALPDLGLLVAGFEVPERGERLLVLDRAGNPVIDSPLVDTGIARHPMVAVPGGVQFGPPDHRLFQPLPCGPPRGPG